MAKPTKPNASEVRLVLRPSPQISMNEIDKMWRAALEEMLLLYFPPFRATTDEELLGQVVVALGAYLEDLAGHPEEALRDAWRATRRAHKTERWPTIQAILANLPASQTNVVQFHGRGAIRPATPQQKADMIEIFGHASERISEAHARWVERTAQHQRDAMARQAAECDRKNAEFLRQRNQYATMETPSGFKSLGDALPPLARP